MSYRGGNHEPDVPNSSAAYQPTVVEETTRSGMKERGLFDNPKIFTGCVWLANIGLATSVTYLGACTSTIEKRFQLKSSQTAFFFTLTDIFGLFTVLFVIYYGQKRNRARVLAALYSICALGSLVCSIPHYLYELPAALEPTSSLNNTAKHDDEEYCSSPVKDVGSDIQEEDCDREDDLESGALISQCWWILLGQLLTSFSSAVFPLIVSCIDDKVSKRNSAMYIAIMFTTFPIGATLGYMIATFCLRLPVTFPMDKLDTYPIGLDDPRWLGAWWFGFVVSGCMVFLFSFPLYFFSDHHPFKKPKNPGSGSSSRSGSIELDQSKISEMSIGFKMPDVSDEDGLIGFIKGLSKSVLRVLRNFTVMAMILATCANTASLAGGRAFGPKYIQNQFNLDTSRAALLTGVVVIPAAFIGTLSGGYVLRKFNLQNKGKALMILILHSFCFVTTMFYLLIGCPNPPTAGLTTNYNQKDSYTSSYVVDIEPINNNDQTSSLIDHCNTDCDCSIDYKPVCGSDETTYVTPCHAGCKSSEIWEVNGKNTTVFVECSCIPTDFTSEFYEYDDGFAFPEACSTGCDNMWIVYISVNMLYFTFITFAANPTLMLQIRVVEERDRSVMMGISNVFMKVFGFIPGPIYFGATIEKACLLFQTSCGKTGNCILYDLPRLRLYFYGLVSCLRAIDLIFVSLVFCSVWFFKKKVTEYKGMELRDKKVTEDGQPGLTEQTFNTA
ncbi:Solute carrier organic anion transporter family member 5A1 [Holothuria leucospilota]|uniref:Solute carrier organic anion transporter family member n=1 Tax=Holothuria leucospilota TaxID=206669 RepID=A0A9Q1CI24_HOLLE|nr:Solute carrier organic anion transporter family member 5A1 [Holothuria leucospilota]